MTAYSAILTLICFALSTIPARSQTALAPAPESVAQHDVFELRLASDEAFANPFTDARLTAEFKSPGGQRFAVPGFYYGGTTWMVRFAPDRAGQWSFQAKLTGKLKTARRSGTFRCVPSRRHGFARVSKRNPYRFEFDDGTPFYPIGVQTCGYFKPDLDGPNEKGSWNTVAPEVWAKEFQGSVNLIRWQLGAGTKKGCALALIPTGGPPDRYDTELARQMDELLVLQKAHGFSHIMIPFQDMSLWGKDTTSFGENTDVDGYKSLKAPNLPLQEAYLRYLVARFGAYVDIWELFNEDSYAPDAYLARLSAVIREADPYRHPITTNYTRSTEDWCEIVTWHGYMSIPAAETDAWLADKVGRLKSFGKPVLNTEFGNKDWLSNVDPVKWRIAVWTAYMNESNILFWGMSGVKTKPGRTQGNSNAYLGPDSRQHFRVLDKFTRELPVDLRPVECTYSQQSDLRIYALSNKKTSVVYAHHFADHEKPWGRNERIYVHTGPGRFRVTWIDPSDGKIVYNGVAETRQQYLFFEMPPVTIDLACRLDREN